MLKSILSVRNLRGKMLLVRVDINSPVKNGKALLNERLLACANTIKVLCKRGARVVLLAHQGRKGEEGFISLESHAKILSRLSGRRVLYLDGFFALNILKKIHNLKNGEVVLLKNIREYENEVKEKSAKVHSKDILVKTLSPLFDYFVNDGFSVSHRSHLSVVGFTKVLPGFIGPNFLEEYKALSKVLKARRPLVFILGGAKVEDAEDVILAHLKDTKKFLVCGVLGELILLADNYKIGRKKRWLEEKDYNRYLKEFKGLLDRVSNKIFYPLDLAYEEGGKRREINLGKINLNTPMVFDIGKKTARLFSKQIRSAKTVVFSGPAGMYENKLFSFGTKKIFMELKRAKRRGVFVLVGGGDTVSALKRAGFSQKDFGYVSLSGGAMIEFLARKKLPGLEALK